MRALIIDDSQLDRKLIRELLDRTGFSFDVEEAQDAIDALELLADDDFDCLFIDQRMPGIIGTEFIRAFREMESGSRTPIFVLSGDDAGVISVEEALGAGGDVFMAKDDLTVRRLSAALRCFGQQK